MNSIRTLGVFLTLLLGSASFLLQAQNTRVYVGLGALYNHFQDARFSDLMLTAVGPSLELGYRQRRHH